RRPARGFANVDEGQVRLPFAVPRRFGKQRRLLRASDGQRLTGRHRGTKPLELGAAQLARGLDLGAATAAPHGSLIERHRFFARAKDDCLSAVGAVGHFLSICRAVLAMAWDWARATLSYNNTVLKVRVRGSYAA